MSDHYEYYPIFITVSLKVRPCSAH